MKVIVNNLALEYDDQGAGPVMLMLHGWKDSLHTFDALIPTLTKEYRVVRLDLPGFGGSDMPQGTWNLDAYIQIVSAFIKKKNLDVEVLVGHSMGGRISIKSVAQKTLQPKRLVLIAAAGLAKRRTWRNTILMVIAKIMKGLTTVPPLSWYRHELRRRLYGAIGSDYFGAGKLKDTYLAIIAEDLTDSAQQITVPTTLIWGKSDNQALMSEGEKMHTLITGSTLHVFAAGHMVHQEHPAEIASLILKQ